MMTERRFSDEEVAALFERAAAAEHATPRPVAASSGMTLAALQDIGREVGIEPELVGRRAKNGGALLTATMNLRRVLAWSLAAAFLTTAVACTPAAEQAITAATAPQPNPHAGDSIGSVREIYDGVLTPELAVNTFRNIDRLFPTRVVTRSANPLPLPPADAVFDSVTTTYRGESYTLDQFIELNRVAGLLVLQDGRVRLERYLLGNTDRTRWMSMSIAKSITSTLIGAAVKEGRITAITDPVTKYVPSLAGSAYDGASVRDVLMMSSGAQWSETYTNPASDRRRLLEAQISRTPGSAMEVMKSLPRAADPGTKNTYNTGETQVAAEIVRNAVGTSLSAYLGERIWSKVGMEADANWWLDSPDGVEIGGSGFSATLRDYGRFGLFMLGGGIAGGEAILPDGWVAEATSPKMLAGRTGPVPLDYGYLWWTGTSATDRRDHAFGAEGIHGQFIYVNPAAKIVIVIWSARPRPSGGAVVDEWAFFDAVVSALR
ncbi:MAG: serine hydrolase [Gemmatimonadetes bacterium]|nr:serine hydrolase [Gemmatimonadota bacterium]